jgi:hypothetical protein
VTYNHRTSVTLSGVVIDTNPANLTVTFGGKVVGSATTDSNGNYTYTANATGLGDVTGVTTDAAGFTSKIALVTLVSAVPQITNFTITSTGGGTYRVSGNVVDEDPNGLTVTFTSDIAALNGQTVSAGADGYFDFTFTTTSTGTLSATTTDWWGLTSPTESVNI